MPRVGISNSVEVVWVWSHKWTCSEWGITGHISECMHVSFLPKEHDITKASHGDVTVMLAAGQDIIIKKV